MIVLSFFILQKSIDIFIFTIYTNCINVNSTANTPSTQSTENAVRSMQIERRRYDLY